MYHRVAELDSDPWSLNVSPKHFAEQLEVLRGYGNPLKLEQLRRKLNDNQPVKRSFVITFDDGYADNYYYAKPLLDKYDIPATVFVTTGVIDKVNEFWWDDLERLLLRPGVLPDLLQIEIRGKKYQWELGDSAQYSEKDHQRLNHWRFLSLPEKNPTRRHFIYRSIYGLLQYFPSNERSQVLRELHRWANTSPVSRDTHRPLSIKELNKIQEGNLFEIGAHSVTHPFLPELPLFVQKNEIENSKSDLEEILGHTVTSFAYPHGFYDTQTVSLVQAAGFKCACSCDFTRVKSSSNLFFLPRMAVENWDGETFSHWLSRMAY
jgi:peptidoglycan/xylan/chitin deacetylase (PgdA/CDA1 family)